MSGESSKKGKVNHQPGIKTINGKPTNQVLLVLDLIQNMLNHQPGIKKKLNWSIPRYLWPSMKKTQQKRQKYVPSGYD